VLPVEERQQPDFGWLVPERLGLHVVTRLPPPDETRQTVSGTAATSRSGPARRQSVTRRSAPGRSPRAWTWPPPTFWPRASASRLDSHADRTIACAQADGTLRPDIGRTDVILLNFLVGLLHRHADPIDRNAARRTPSRARRPPRAPHTTRPGGLPSDRRDPAGPSLPTRTARLTRVQRPASQALTTLGVLTAARRVVGRAVM
jgi:hypothetical protein